MPGTKKTPSSQKNEASNKKTTEEQLTAKAFVDALHDLQSPAELVNVKRYFRDHTPGNLFIGVRMQEIFALAKDQRHMPLSEVDKLLQMDCILLPCQKKDFIPMLIMP
jgi:hypothetical protein